MQKSVSDMLQQEREFFDSDTRDKLKVPPFSKVKRSQRDYTNEEKIVLKYKHQREEEEKARKHNEEMQKNVAQSNAEASRADDSSR